MMDGFDFSGASDIPKNFNFLITLAKVTKRFYFDTIKFIRSGIY